MDRREFLVAGATLALTTAGGCTGCARAPTASLRMETITDEEVAKRVTYRSESADPDQRQLVTDAIANGTATAEGTEPPFPADRPFVYNGSVYRLSHEVVESKPATVFHFTLNPAEESVPDDEKIRFEDLPAVDRRKFARNGWADPEFLGFGSSLRYLDDEIPESALVPDPENPVVVWGEEARGRFEVDGSYATELKTYRYGAEQVHPSASEYGAEIRREYAFSLSNLTNPERDVVREAIENERGYSVPHDESLPDAVWRLAERFRPREEVRYAWEDDRGETRPIDGTYLVRYDGEVYWTRIHVSRAMRPSTTRE